MKKTMRRTLGIVLVMAVTMSSVIGGNRTFGVPGAGRARAAESAGKYINDLAVSYADSKEKAEEELGEEYTVLDADLNKGNSGHTWLGYTTTDSEDMAVRDIKVMDMNGGFSISDFDEMVKKHEQEFDEQMQAIIPAVREFAKNYDAGVPAATGMMGYLNSFYENDSEKGMGDYILDAGHALNQNSDDSAVIADLKKVFMQGNTEFIKTIERLLMQAQGSKLKNEGSWLSRLSEMGPDGLKKIYQKAYPGTPAAKLKATMKKELDDDAKMLLNQMSIVRELLGGTDHKKIREALEKDDVASFEKIVEGEAVPEAGAEVDESMSPEESMEELAKTINSSVVDIENAQKIIDATLAMRLMNAPYGDSNLFDFFMREDLKAEDLYPMAYLLSAGQKSLFDDVGIHTMFWSAMAGDAQKDQTSESEQTSSDDRIQISIYDGCERNEFEGDTAVTTEAMKRSSSSGKSLFMDSTAYNVILVSSALVSVGAFVFAARYNSNLPFDDFMTKGEQIAKAEEEKLLNLKNALEKEYQRVYQDCTTAKINYIEKKKLWRKANPMRLSEDIKARSVAYDLDLQLNNKAAYGELYKSNGYFTELNNKINKARNAFEAKKLEYDNFDKSVSKEKAYNKLSKGSSVPKGAARAVGIVCAVVAVAFAAYEIYCMTSSDKTEYTDIPGKIIDRSYPEGSEEIKYINYYAVTTADGKKADIHRKKTDKWVALYTSTDKEAGEPIYAASLSTSNDSAMSNADMIAVSAFGESASYQLSKEDAAYMFFGRNENAVSVTEKEETPDDTDAESEEQADPDAKASVFGSTAMWIMIALLVVIIIAAGTGLWLRRRKRIK